MKLHKQSLIINVSHCETFAAVNFKYPLHVCIYMKGLSLA